jgi:hypothetical protein
MPVHIAACSRCIPAFCASRIDWNMRLWPCDGLPHRLIAILGGHHHQKSLLVMWTTGRSILRVVRFFSGSCIARANRKIRSLPRGRSSTALVCSGGEGEPLAGKYLCVSRCLLTTWSCAPLESKRSSFTMSGRMRGVVHMGHIARNTCHLSG